MIFDFCGHVLFKKMIKNSSVKIWKFCEFFWSVLFYFSNLKETISKFPQICNTYNNYNLQQYLHNYYDLQQYVWQLQVWQLQRITTSHRVTIIIALCRDVASLKVMVGGRVNFENLLTRIGEGGHVFRFEDPWLRIRYVNILFYICIRS